jgi:UDP-4-amino-4,6-dideoxy-N-acetyl-beta-L-altrosamine transaminase
VNDPGRRFLPYGRQEIDDDDIAAVTAVLRSDWLTTGPAVDAFEAALAARTGAKFAVACASATAGLHLSTLALRLGPGDLAIVPTLTFLATANAVRYVGAEVVFADVDPDTGLMRTADLEAAIARAPKGRLRAALPVHLTGRLCDMAGLAAVARQHGIDLIEDAAHAIGTVYDATDGREASAGDCAFSRMAVFSFHPVKTMTSGEGGAVTTNDAELAARLRHLRSHGMLRDPADFTDRTLAFAADGRPNPWYYEMPELGFHYRATDIHCALGLSQLGKLDRFVARRQQLMGRYRQALAALAPLVRMAPAPNDCRPGWHLCVALIDFARAGVDRATVLQRLRDQGVGSQVHYIPVHHQPYYRQRYGALSLPGADGYYQRCLSLPLYPAMIDGDVDHVVDALSKALRRP